MRVPVKVIKTWSAEQRAEAERYAGAILIAEGRRPAFLPPPLVLVHGGEPGPEDEPLDLDRALGRGSAEERPAAEPSYPQGTADMPALISSLSIEAATVPELLLYAAAGSAGGVSHENNALYAIGFKLLKEIGAAHEISMLGDEGLAEMLFLVEERMEVLVELLRRASPSIAAPPSPAPSPSGLPRMFQTASAVELERAALPELLLFALAGTEGESAHEPLEAIALRQAEETEALSEYSAKADSGDGPEFLLHMAAQRGRVFAELVRRFGSKGASDGR